MSGRSFESDANVASINPSRWAALLRCAFGWLQAAPTYFADPSLETIPDDRGHVALAYTNAFVTVAISVESWSGTIDVCIRPLGSSPPSAGGEAQHFLSGSDLLAGLGHLDPRIGFAGSGEHPSFSTSVTQAFSAASVLWHFRVRLLLGDAVEWQRIALAGAERNRRYTAQFRSEQ